MATITLAADGTGSIETDVCVVGGGSGGVSAALAAARAGARVVLVERMPRLGGTSTSACVSSWEPGPGDSHAREIYERLRKIDGAGVTSHQNPGHKRGPFGLWLVTPEVPYEETLHRSDTDYEKCHGVAFDPEKMSRVMAGLLAETGRYRVLLNTRFVSAQCHDGRVETITAQPADGAALRIRAKVFVDSTGNADLCRAAGCETMVGAEPKARFEESSAPDEAARTLNSISLCYRIHKTEKPAAPPEPAAPVKWFPRAAHVTAVPGSDDLIVNPLGVLPGEALLSLGYEKAYEACKPIVQAHWKWMHGHPLFASYEFRDLAPALGIRESYRVVGEYVLTQRDLAGAANRPKHTDIIAIADHAMDIHGSGRASSLEQVKAPYGIPYRCLVPKGMANLLIACRGASFSHIAASSCRLSRTIIALGHAAGLAAAQAARTGVSVSQVDVAAIQKELQLPANVVAIPPTQPAAATAGTHAWTSLFDGKSLRGWTRTDFSTLGDVHVENPFRGGPGAIVVALAEELNGVTCTRPVPKTHYEVSLEAMRLGGHDFFCGLTFPVGDAAATLVVGGWSGSVVGISCIDGADASVNETTRIMDFDPNRWYRIRVRVTPAKIECWVDETKVADVALAGHKVGLRPGEIERSLPFGLAAWHTSAAWRNIRLQQLR